jgi:hypothetical protein
MCRFLGRPACDAGGLGAGDGRRPRSAKARNRGLGAAATQAALWGFEVSGDGGDVG